MIHIKEKKCCARLYVYNDTTQIYDNGIRDKNDTKNNAFKSVAYNGAF